MAHVYVPHPTIQDYRAAGLANGLSRRNQDLYRERYLRQEEITHNVLTKVHAKIEWAYTSYEAAKVRSKDNIELLTEITLNWTPERVLSTYKHFEKMCAYLNNDRIWRMLNRHERKFIAKAYQYFIDRRQS